MTNDLSDALAVPRIKANANERRSLESLMERWVSSIPCPYCGDALTPVGEPQTSDRLHALEVTAICPCDAVELRVMWTDCAVGISTQRALSREAGGTKAELTRTLNTEYGEKGSE